MALFDKRYNLTSSSCTILGALKSLRALISRLSSLRPLICGSALFKVPIMTNTDFIALTPLYSRSKRREWVRRGARERVRERVRESQGARERERVEEGGMKKWWTWTNCFLTSHNAVDRIISERRGSTVHIISMPTLYTLQTPLRAVCVPLSIVHQV